MALGHFQTFGLRRAMGFLAGLILTLSAGFSAHAESSTTATLPTSDSSKQKNLSLALQVGESVGLSDDQNGKREKSFDTEASLGYRLSKDYKLSGAVAGSIDQNDYENNDMGKAVIGLSHSAIDYFSSINHQKMMSFQPSLALSLPISKQQRNQSFQSGVSLGFKSQLEEGLLPSHRLGLSLSLSATRNFFTYEQSIDGSSNAQYASAQSLAVSADLTQKFGFAVTLNHYNSWTFQGTAGEMYSHSEEFAYTFNPLLTVAFGHQFGNPAASIYRADGQTMNLSLVNESDSIVYVNANLSY